MRYNDWSPDNLMNRVDIIELLPCFMQTVHRHCPDNAGELSQALRSKAQTGDHSIEPEVGDGQLVLERKKVAVRPPPLYQVLMLDDDFTPMDFVVETLQQFFSFSREKATETMLKVHNQGYAVCGIFTRDVAETKSSLVLDYAREHQHPLYCRVEPQEE